MYKGNNVLKPKISYNVENNVHIYKLLMVFC